MVQFNTKYPMSCGNTLNVMYRTFQNMCTQDRSEMKEVPIGWDTGHLFHGPHDNDGGRLVDTTVTCQWYQS